MREISKIREYDEKIEILNNEYLTKNFYNIKVDKFIRNTNKRLQILGVDVIFIMNSEQFNCDEKVAAHYINKPLQTFAFELSFIDKNGNVKDGWFLDKFKLNNSYLLCWLDESESDNPTKYSQIKKGEILLIYKDKLIEYLETLNWNVNKLRLKCGLIRSGRDKNLGNINKDGIKFSYSEGLVEKPINFIVSREILRKYSYYNEIISNVTAL